MEPDQQISPFSTFCKSPHSVNLKSFVFSKREDLEEHVKVEYLTTDQHKCPVCKHKFNRRFGLKNHVEKVHLGHKRFKCDECDYISAEKRELTIHQTSKHKPHLRLFQCDICNKKFSKSGNLKAHVSIVHVGLFCKVNIVAVDVDVEKLGKGRKQFLRMTAYSKHHLPSRSIKVGRFC